MLKKTLLNPRTSLTRETVPTLKSIAVPVIPTSLSLLSSYAAAHPGHDHSHWSSAAAHALLALAIVGLAAAGGWAYRHHQQKLQQQRKEK